MASLFNFSFVSPLWLFVLPVGFIFCLIGLIATIVQKIGYKHVMRWSLWCMGIGVVLTITGYLIYRAIAGQIPPGPYFNCSWCPAP